VKELKACPICGAEDSTNAIEYNGLVLLESMRHSPLTRYDYALCHGCGVVYAKNRPVGDELRYLYAHFDQYLGRAKKQGLLANKGPLTEEQRTEMEGRLADGWLVSELRGKSSGVSRLLFNERVFNSFHVNILASLCNLQGARILHIRTKFGMMLDIMRRHFGAAEVYAMAICEMHRFITQKATGIPCELVNFETLEIPFEEQFDLIIANHILTHAQDPQRFFANVRRKLRPNGCIYFYLENDDAMMFRAKNKNLVGEMKCFHFQNFDMSTLARILWRQGFEVEYIGHPVGGHAQMVCLARLDPAARPRSIENQELAERREMYHRWRDMSILSCPRDVRCLWGSEVTHIQQRAIQEGYAEMTESRTGWRWGWGRKRSKFTLKKRLRIMHEEGYKSLNARVGATADSA
jgi:hypothetical protein